MQDRSTQPHIGPHREVWAVELSLVAYAVLYMARQPIGKIPGITTLVPPKSITFVAAAASIIAATTSGTISLNSLKDIII